MPLKGWICGVEVDGKDWNLTVLEISIAAYSRANESAGTDVRPSTFLAESSCHAASDEWSSTCFGMRELP
jgi:hypothetical protein